MFDSKKVCSILYIILLTIVNGNIIPRKPIASESNDFDLLIFTQHWPPTVCYKWKTNSASHKCYFPKEKDEWSIHGLWPSQLHKLGPQFCNKSLVFNSTALKPLIKQLQEKWIDVQEGTESSSLWQHEWNKHGTCAVVIEQLNTEYKYFAKGLNLLATYDMKHVLAKANIIPGKAYAKADILHAIEKVLGKRGAIMCQKNQQTGESYIFEIRICFDKTLQLIDCDGIYGYPTNCDNSKLVTYLSEVPHGYTVVQM
ncbi:ribonuclease Oy [Osmia lignaria lignaria]|uniref:ribonuclease Oy n=1 Tax=Osmia lignaria lignaria TaxID=1437193 RepID=UPI0014789420|nr:ribonuclease Oy [Osmia lignaria]